MQSYHSAFLCGSDQPYSCLWVIHTHTHSHHVNHSLEAKSNETSGQSPNLLSPAESISISYSVARHHFENTQAQRISTTNYTSLKPPWQAILLTGQNYNQSGWWYAALRAALPASRHVYLHLCLTLQCTGIPEGLSAPWPGHRNSFIPIDFCAAPLNNSLGPGANSAGLGSGCPINFASFWSRVIMSWMQLFVASLDDLEVTSPRCTQTKAA